ncbi:hypothetical protein N9Y96_05130 [Gammaproteobacteria bacterium]|jgi:hypothetical protein|nr:hypothetical protein [Gammaproteobacteria bacterium]MDB9840963.1 hypothetical protein [Gammaproteobacteria bacterium]
MHKILTIISFLIIASCTTIQEYENLTQETGVLLSTSVNGVIFKVQKEKDLPNAYGKKDIFGGMVDQGEKVLRFMGLNQNGNLVLRLSDVDIKSNENVFTRYNIARAPLPSFPKTPVMTQGTMIGGNQPQNQVTTITNNNTVVITDAPEARIDRLPENVYEFEFDYKQNKVLDLGYITVLFENVTAYSIKYVLSE